MKPRFLILAAVSALAVARTSSAADDLQFARDVRPILSDKCFKCHGPDERARKADLRFDLREAAIDALSPESPQESELLRRITSTDADERMPPPGSKLSLTPAEIKTLTRWIETGAEYEGHWSFQSIRRPGLPDVSDKSWVRNAIDRFVLARLEREGLKPNGEASRERIIRRLSFDLTGLPPTLEEVDEFVADKSDDPARALVDRLLKSPAYGERMASDWLDVARYADTFGYQVDRDRHVWPWRDWVIRAFNSNMPFDEFVTLQLAGDLLPEATDDQILATTFNRLHSQKVEGGSVPEEFRTEYVADRTHTFATAFLGLTMECCRCHDHKYDPIAQTEYYQLFAFFNSIDEAGVYSYFTRSTPTPTLLLRSDAQKKQIADIERRIAEEEQKLKVVAKARRTAFDQWLKSDKRTSLVVGMGKPKPTQERKEMIPGRIKHLDFEDHKGGANASVPGFGGGKAIRLSGDDGFGVGVGNFPRFAPFTIELHLNTPDVKKRAVVFHRSRAWTDAGSRGYQLLIEDGRLSASLIHFWPGNAIRVRTKDAIPTGKWLHVAVSWDGSSRAEGLRLYVNGKPAETVIVRDNLYKNITGGGGDNITIGARFRDRGFTNGLVDDFGVYDRELTPIEIATLHDGHSLPEPLSRPAEQLKPLQVEQLFEYYLATVDEEYAKQLAALKAVREERSKAVDGIAEIMVMRDMPERRATFRLKRGSYELPEEQVEPGTPSIFPAMQKELPANRLGLAKWLTDPSHPLLARVTVNRLWQMCFGEGLVRTPEDFGSQGQPPTHPQLLDWLASEFIESGWDVQHMLKLMVTSATYRQRSIATREQYTRDPDNRLLSRGSSYRMPGEMIRDNALAVSGLLVDKTGGAPAKPYEVNVSFKPVGRDKGEGLYRRSVYTFWKRTAPAPVMMSLDASKREVCTVKRERTSSPLQALVLMNDPQMVEAARVLGQNLLRKHGENTEVMLDEMFRLLTGRRPSDAEAAVIRTLFDEQLTVFKEDSKSAGAFLKTGDAPQVQGLAQERAAAAGVVANALLNHVECVSKR